MDKVSTHYGNMLAEKIRANTTDYSKISDFDKFVLDHGYKYAARKELRAGYDRHWDASRGRIIGIPYYDATDYQFIRFDCAYMGWLWKNRELYQVYH